MAIAATFTEGLTRSTVHGLHQWDYGQVLEIHDETLPALIEVHFGCPGVAEAAVRSCSVINGVAAVPIPNTYLEQSAPLTAWVYLIEAESGETVRTITMPIIPRTRPSTTPEEVPEDVSSVYAQSVEELNGLMAELGDIDRALDLLHSYAQGVIARGVS